MKTKYQSAVLTALLAMTPMQAFAQNSASKSTSGTATIAAPIVLTENSTLRFGSLTRPTSGSQTVTLDSTSGCTRALGGAGSGAALISSTSGCATYTVTGESGQTFDIATDTSFDMTRSGGTETLTVTMNKSAATGTIGQSSAAFSVGGSVPVSATTVAGAYSGSFNVTVTYQ